MRHWLAAMTHPDGGIAFFNDAAFEIAAEPAAIEDYARRLELAAIAAPGEGVTHLAASGYIRVARGAAVAILDVANVGPDHLPGHAHADTLSFELSLAGERVIVNGGVSCYGSGPQRQRERSTAAHSTVEIDGRNSSDVWAGFRVGRRARPFGLTVEDGAQLRIACSHDGYAWLKKRPLHRREWLLSPRSLCVRDQVAGGAGRARARFHLAPDVAAACDAAAGGTLQHGARKTAWHSSVPALIEPFAWHPEFGRTVATSSIVVPFRASRRNQFRVASVNILF